MAKTEHPLTEEAKNEIERFRKEIAALEKGEREEDDFKRFRLNNGVYGIRFQPDQHMIRIKIPFGFFTADQLDTVTDIKTFLMFYCNSIRRV